MTQKQAIPTPPKHLRPRSKKLWGELCERYEFEAHDVERLRLLCENLDVIDQCEAEISKAGLFVLDRYGQQKAHPAFAVARDARQLVLRTIRELCIDIETPDEARVPRQNRRYA